MAENTRQRLRPWLEGLLDREEIPGLNWIGPDRTMFQIPWKHGGKQEWEPADSIVFKAWAVHTGRYREGIDEPEYATWKTRLRCAFNKASDIEEMKQYSQLEGDTPFKVYKLLPRNERLRLENNLSPLSYHSESSRPINEMVPQTVPDSDDTFMTLGSLNSIATPDLLYATQGFSQTVMMDSTMDTEPDFKIEQAMSPPMDDDQVIVEGESYPTNVQTGEPLSFETQQLLPVNTGMNVPGLDHNIQQPTGQDFLVKINYRNKEVFEKSVSNTAGCRLYYGTVTEILQEKHEEYYGQREALQIHLPPCQSLVRNQKQQQLTNTLLSSMERGLLIWCHEGNIYAKRYCRTRIFYHHPHSDEEPILLKRFEETMIFDYQNFCQEYRQYTESKEHKRPSIHVNLGIGQKWHSNQATDKIMISAYVVCAHAWFCLQMLENRVDITASMENMEISSATSSDHILGTLKDLCNINPNMIPGFPQALTA